MATRRDNNLQNTKRRGKVFANGKQRRVKRLMRKRETSDKKFVTVDYFQSIFYNLPMGYKSHVLDQAKLASSEILILN